jgi:predicted dithiol-disulfide oxidoreductase (DUF899 family)
MCPEMNAALARPKRPTVVSREQWLAARKTLLEKERALAYLHDALSAERRSLPWVRVEKSYVFDGPHGRETLADLFERRSRLIVHHCMLGPARDCSGCPFLEDDAGAALVRLEHHDVSFVRVARAPLSEITSLKDRMGWRGKWVSSDGSDFNYDYGVSFSKEDVASGKALYNYGTARASQEDLHGISLFAMHAGEVFHTYSAYGRTAPTDRSLIALP